MPLAGALAATAGSAVLFGLSFPPWSVKPLAWVALTPWLWALRTGSLSRALALALLWSLVAAYTVGDWMPEAVAVYFLQPRPVGLLFFVGVVAVMAAPYYAAFAAAYRTLARTVPPALLPWSAAAAWVAAELGRGRLLTGSPLLIGNPWGLIGYSQAGHDALVQIAAWTGVYGIGFAVVAVNACWLELALHARADRRLAARAVGAGVLPAALALAYGMAALPSPAEERAHPGVPVAAVQGHAGLGTRWRPEFYGLNLDVYLTLTAEAARSRPEVVFWPEAALNFFLEGEPRYRRAIADALSAADLELVTGGPRAEAGGRVVFNTVFSLTPQGEVRGRYDKQYLVPFSEYVPLGSLDLVRRRFEGARVFSPGGEAALLPTRAGRAGVLTCNEAMLPEVAARRVRDGAEYLFNPSNDTWIPEEKFTDHLFAIVSLRAVEQRRWLVRASTSGPSAIVDPWGRVTRRTPAFERSFLVGVVRPRRDLTPYARVGDLFAAGCAAAVALVLLASVGRRPAAP